MPAALEAPVEAAVDAAVEPEPPQAVRARAAADTPAAAAGRERQARQDQAVASIEQDSFVRDVIETFDASLVDSSIKPIA